MSEQHSARQPVGGPGGRPEPPNSIEIAVLGPGRVGRQIALAFAVGGCHVRLVDLKPRRPGEALAVFADARREIARDLALMAEERVIAPAQLDATLARIVDHVGLDGLRGVDFAQEVLPELIDLKRETFAELSDAVDDDAIIACGSSTISPRHLVDAVKG